jgi:hypothetical protein
MRRTRGSVIGSGTSKSGTRLEFDRCSRSERRDGSPLNFIRLLPICCFRNVLVLRGTADQSFNGLPQPAPRALVHRRIRYVLSRREVDLPHLPRATSRGRLLARQRASHGDVPTESTVGVMFRAKRYRQVGVRARRTGAFRRRRCTPRSRRPRAEARSLVPRRSRSHRCEGRALLLRQFPRGAEA